MIIAPAFPLLLLLAAFSSGYRLSPGGVATHPLPGLDPRSLTAVTVSFETLAALDEAASLDVRVSDGAGLVAEKTLHAGDPDFTLLVRPRVAGEGSVKLAARGTRDLPEVSVDAREVPLAGEKKTGYVLAAQPNATWRDAQPVPLGATVVGFADERPYVPQLGVDPYPSLVAGVQWFRVTRDKDDAAVLAHFSLDVLDRDVPSDVDVFVANDDGSDVVPYAFGDDPYLVEATQSLPGLQRFRTRILRGGTYFLRVSANHPFFTLRTSLYPVPPYTDPRQAVRTASDYLLNRGDAWHMNTPRRGAIALRTAQPHVETSLCIACHPTQFPARAALTALENGYPVRQRPSLSFLMERIRENARPLYGEPGVNWVRVIYSARTVSSRLPLLADAFERLVTREAPAPGFAEGYGNFLLLHYAGVDALPGEETDGCAPSVSPFEIAWQSFLTARLLADRTGAPEWSELRDRIARMTPPAPVKNVIDLSWKIVALHAIDPEKNRAAIAQLIHDLYLMQRPDGRWGYSLGEEGPSSDFISFHAAWALAVSGRRVETDARLKKTADLILSRQLPSGGFRGDPVYKGFDTPFRDTQFAVMALSALFPGPGGTGWNAGFPPPPASASADTADAFLAAADAYWDPPGEEALASLRRALAESAIPIVRAGAAAALGRVADTAAVPQLAAALGDATKAVRREAARALREIAARRNESGAAADAIARALASPDDRTRWGATRVFNQHFREIALARPEMEGALVRALEDPVVMVRFHAVSALWRFNLWRSDRQDERAALLAAITDRLGVPEHPWVRRALVEALYDVLDENTGYLDAWIRAVPRENDRTAIRSGFESIARERAVALALSLESGNALRRDGVLTALWDFHLRHAALPSDHGYEVELPAVNLDYVAGLPDLHRVGFEYRLYRDAADFEYSPRNTITKTRVGNDSDLVKFAASAGGELERAIVACFGAADAATRVNALKASTALGEASGEALVRGVLERTLDADPAVRAAARYLYEDGVRGRLRLDPATAPSEETLAVMRRILEEAKPDGLAVLLPLLAAAGPDSALSRDESLARGLSRLVSGAAAGEIVPSARAISAAGAFPSLLATKGIREAILGAFRSPDRETRRAALRVAFLRLLDRPDAAAACQEALATLDTAGRLVLLEEMTRDAGLFGQPAVAGAFIDCLTDADDGVRAAAADLLSRRAELHEVPAVRLALERLRTDGNERVRQIAMSLLAGADPASALAGRDVESLFDFAYFRDRVQPIFAAVGPDGNACVTCHASHAILRLAAPGDDGHFSEAASRANYFSALKVADAANPEKSLLLVKPTRPTDSEGDVSEYAATHVGGRRFAGDERSEEYATILAWLRGAK